MKHHIPEEKVFDLLLLLDFWRAWTLTYMASLRFGEREWWQLQTYGLLNRKINKLVQEMLSLKRTQILHALELFFDRQKQCHLEKSGIEFYIAPASETSYETPDQESPFSETQG